MHSDPRTQLSSCPYIYELNTVLNLKLRSVDEWVEENKWVFSISRMNSIVYGSNHSLGTKPNLNICINDEYIKM